MGFCRSFTFATLLQAALFAARGSALCECGYSVNATSDPHHQVFTEAWESDFLHLSSITQQVGWQPQVYSVKSQDARGPNGKLAQLENVLPNPLKNRNSWSGPAVHGGDPGLHMIVRSALNNSMIPMAEIDSIRNDMWYGSYRVGVKHSNVSGTCGAFFWYRNNTQEIDMEFLSREFSADNSTANLVIQTPASAAAGFDASGTPDFGQPALPFDPSAGYHEYRFDWMPGQVNFYVDGALLDSMTDSIPDSPGHIVLNHWSNGDPKWSGGPPASDAFMTVMYVKAYFNASATHPSYAKACPSYDPAKVCTIPDQTAPPVLTGNTPPTHFFSADKDSTKGQTTSNSTWDANGQHNAAPATLRPAGAAAVYLLGPVLLALLLGLAPW